MRFGPRRGHFLFIFERFFRDFGLLLAAVVISLVLGDYQKLLENVPVLVVVLFAPISRLIQYLFTYYSIDDEKLLVESGWIKKKTQEIPLTNITTVDFSQNIVFQLFKVYSVNVDNAGSISGDSGKVKMAFKMKDAIAVKQLLLSKRQQPDPEIHNDRISEDDSGNTILAGTGEILLMGLLRSKALVVIQVLAYGGVAISLISRIFLSKNVDGQELMLNYFLSISAPLLIAALIIALYLLGVAINVILTTIKYYGFRITNRENSIFIEYGLLNKKTYTLIKEKISGVSYNQSILMRIFKRGTLEVFAVGYGSNEEDSQEVAILYPIIKKDRLEFFLKRFLPELELEKSPIGTEAKAFPYFFLCGRFLFSALLLLSAAVSTVFFIRLPIIKAVVLVVCLLIFLSALASVILEYGNTAMAADSRTVFLTCGGFTKRTVLLRTETIEYIEERATTRKKRKRGLTTIRLGILAPPAVSHQRVRNLAMGVFEEVREKLTY
ncbi:MAG: PH domain-containing protein [Clostridiales Family XIII bacterium]|uniref:PH domain-containing protein n=1 Tax=Hominibacterium faecale TaxID=2839743 RepID=UPI0022B2A161|nr:PH domain-containing protein [Hominibacterium faecale]MCI7303551.1 PH domain-containing protein [Clostridia bacterium]MDY3012960.1 PH domain-containing protein [Clostridiales Family XIII bacterium]